MFDDVISVEFALVSTLVECIPQETNVVLAEIFDPDDVLALRIGTSCRLGPLGGRGALALPFCCHFRLPRSTSFWLHWLHFGLNFGRRVVTVERLLVCVHRTKACMGKHHGRLG